MYTKKSLVIQGPIISQGRSGSSENDIVSYNTIDNINRIYEENKFIFDDIVLVIWKSDTVYASEINVKKVVFIRNFMVNYRQDLSYAKSNNKLKQFKSTMRGLKFLIDLGYTDNDIIFKIRTDQYLNFSSIINFKFFNRIYVPNIASKGVAESLLPSAFLKDYYFAGKIREIKTFLESFIENPIEFSESVHTDALFKYGFILYPNYKRRVYYTKKNRLNKDNIELIKELFCNHISPLPKELFSTLIWRGKPIEKIQIKYGIFHNEWEEKLQLDFIYKINEIALPRISFLNKFSLIDIENYSKNKYRLNIFDKLNVVLSKSSTFENISYFVYRFQRKILKIAKFKSKDV